MGNPFLSLSPRARRIVYAVFGFLALGVACTDIALGDSDPFWVGRVQDVIIFLTVPITALAASNVVDKLESP